MYNMIALILQQMINKDNMNSKHFSVFQETRIFMFFIIIFQGIDLSLPGMSAWLASQSGSEKIQKLLRVASMGDSELDEESFWGIMQLTLADEKTGESTLYFFFLFSFQLIFYFLSYSYSFIHSSILIFFYECLFPIFLCLFPYSHPIFCHLFPSHSLLSIFFPFSPIFFHLILISLLGPLVNKSCVDVIIEDIVEMLRKKEVKHLTKILKILHGYFEWCAINVSF